jgi:hypothetical protein
MTSDLVNPAQASMEGHELTLGRVMGWFFLLSSLFWPRFGILAWWIFSDLLGRAYGSWVVPVLGFVFLPWTTVTYAMMWGFSSDRVYGVEWLVVAAAFALDVATYLGWRAMRD